MITCFFNNCVHNNGQEGCLNSEADISLYSDNYNMLFECTEMDLSKEDEDDE